MIFITIYLQPKLEVKKLGPLAALIPQNKGLGASDIPLPAESLTAKRKQKPRKAQGQSSTCFGC